MPDELQRLLQGGLRDRLRSATDCYFDLGDHVVQVEGGHLLHLVSDSQWVFHWLLFLGSDGGSAVIGTRHPTGFILDAEEEAFWQQESFEYIILADSFAEFLWRWWMDNEIFYRVVVEEAVMTPDQLAYVEQYGAPRMLI